MRPEIKTYLEDIRQAASLILKFTEDKDWTDYRQDPLLRSGVERQFEIMGEAIGAARRIQKKVVSQITNYERIIVECTPQAGHVEPEIDTCHGADLISCSNSTGLT